MSSFGFYTRAPFFPTIGGSSQEPGQTPVRLVWYPGEGHGNRASAARLDDNPRMLERFEHYLKGPGGAPPPESIDHGKD